MEEVLLLLKFCCCCDSDILATASRPWRSKRRSLVGIKSKSLAAVCLAAAEPGVAERRSGICSLALNIESPSEEGWERV